MPRSLGVFTIAIDTSVYERQRRGINEDYGAQSATNAYARFLSQQRGERSIADYTQGFKRGLPNLTAAYGRKGLAGGRVRSGVYGRSMQNYIGDYTQGLNRQLADVATQNRQYDLTEAQLSSARDRALADMESDKAKEIALAAQYLSALRPQFSTGG
jgi:hypothetical protein